MVFIDADHKHESSIRDFNLAFPYVVEDGFIFLHDTYPAADRWTSYKLCGDTYKTAEYIRMNYNRICEIFTIPLNPGLSLVRKCTYQMQWKKQITPPSIGYIYPISNDVETQQLISKLKLLCDKSVILVDHGSGLNIEKYLTPDIKHFKCVKSDYPNLGYLSGYFMQYTRKYFDILYVITDQECSNFTKSELDFEHLSCLDIDFCNYLKNQTDHIQTIKSPVNYSELNEVHRKTLIFNLVPLVGSKITFRNFEMMFFESFIYSLY